MISARNRIGYINISDSDSNIIGLSNNTFGRYKWVGGTSIVRPSVVSSMNSPESESNGSRERSSHLVDGPHRAPARSMLKAVGFRDADLHRPLIGIANTWIEIGPCTYHLRNLAQYVREGIKSAGGTPMEFNTVSISDGITMGTPGMRMSLVSRELITDSIEMVVDGNQLDGVIALVGCDKTIPGGAMALARLDVPGLVLYGGSIAPGHSGGHDVTIQDVFEAVGAHAAGSSRPTRWPASATSSDCRRWE
jgi:dihydroxyacid dehydratase/phosphogluconate dehydratase